MAEDQDNDVEEVLDAIVVTSFKSSDSQGRRQLNISAASTAAVAVVFLLLAMFVGESIVKQTIEEDFGGDW